MTQTSTNSHDASTVLVCPTCEDTGPFWACVIPTCPVLQCSECGTWFRVNTGGTGGTACLAHQSTTSQ